MANKVYKPLLIDSVKAAVDIEQHRFIGFDGNYCSQGAKALGVSDVAIEKEQYVPMTVRRPADFLRKSRTIKWSESDPTPTTLHRAD